MTVAVRQREPLLPVWVRGRTVERATDLVTLMFEGEQFIPRELLDDWPA